MPPESRAGSAPPRFVVGDVHGELDRLTWLLSSAGLAGPDLRWTGADSTLWFVGDFVDRGPHGVEVLDLVMRLQAEAAAAGGRVGSVMGNHDVMLLAARRFGGTEAGAMFTRWWQRNGGRERDLDLLTERHCAWIAGLPAVALDGETLILHADTAFYGLYGDSVDQVNQAVGAVLAGEDARAWADLIDAFCTRLEFVESAEAARGLLERFGGSRIVHGHTPIWLATGLTASSITRPLVYAGGLCVNVDAGLYSGAPGFVYELES